jgi:hypothetical protein
MMVLGRGNVCQGTHGPRTWTFFHVTMTTVYSVLEFSILGLPPLCDVILGLNNGEAGDMLRGDRAELETVTIY